MKKIIFFLSLIVTTHCLKAQEGHTKTTISHTTNLPVGSFGNFITNPSFRGITADVQYFITDKISAGLQAGYYDLYQKFNRKVYQYSDVDVSAVKSNSVQMIPVMAKVGYSKPRTGSSLFEPYAALGAGINLIMYQEWWGTLVDEKNKWGFTAAPEIGTRIAFSKYSTAGLDVSLRYQFSGFNYAELKNMQMISLNVGVFFFKRE